MGHEETCSVAILLQHRGDTLCGVGVTVPPSATEHETGKLERSRHAMVGMDAGNYKKWRTPGMMMSESSVGRAAADCRKYPTGSADIDSISITTTLDDSSSQEIDPSSSPGNRSPPTLQNIRAIHLSRNTQPPGGIS